MNKQPKVSVIITTYNRRDLLVKAIQSVKDQTYHNIETIVVNDAGEDVNDIIESFSFDMEIKYIHKEKNAGLGAARNTGLENATGQYVNFLDDDDMFYPFHIQTLVEYLVKHDAEIAYTDAVAHVFQNGRLANRVIIYSFDYDPDMILYQNITPVLTVMYELNDITKEFRFDESARVYEDWLMWLEITKHFDMHHVPVPTCMYRLTNDGSTMSSSRNEFVTMLPDIYRETFSRAKNQVNVAVAMNSILQNAGLKPMFQIQ